MIDLPGEVSLITTFTPVLQFPASAGIGLFNASFSNDYPQGTFAFIFYAWLSSPYEMTAPVSIVDPVVCSGPECFTYLYSIGISGISPHPDLITAASEADTVIVQGEQVLQVDYWNVSSAEDPFTADDCQLYGGTDYAFIICIKMSTLVDDSLIAGTDDSRHDC